MSKKRVERSARFFEVATRSIAFPIAQLYNDTIIKYN